MGERLAKRGGGNFGLPFVSRFDFFDEVEGWRQEIGDVENLAAWPNRLRLFPVGQDALLLQFIEGF